MPTHKARFKGSFFSENGRYQLFRIYQKGYTGITVPLKIGGGGVKIQYDNSGQEKFSPIMSSKCSISLIVENNAFGNNLEYFIYDLQHTFEEGDVNLVIWNTGSLADDPIWSGNILIDLGAKEDVSKPYEVELTATDGLGLLKNYDMVKTQGTNPYVSADTYISDGYQTFIYWIKEILALCNVPDNDSTDGVVADYKFSTAVDWWYQEHPAVAQSVSPLAYTKMQMIGSYSVTEDGLYKVKNAYEVLESICKMWGMKVVFWKNRFYFTQIELYNTTDTGTFAAPDNIDTQIWEKDGTAFGSQSYLGSTYYTLYTQEIQTNIGGFDGGLQKLAGSKWDYYPKLKEVVVDFASISNVNYFQTFPQPTTTTTRDIDLITSSPIGTFTGASGFSGFNVLVVLDFDNTSGSTQDYWFNFGVRAKPSADANFANGYYISNMGGASPTWTAYPGTSSTAFLSSMSVGNLFIDARINLTFPIGTFPLLPGVSQKTLFSGVIPSDSNFTGDWDFEFFTFATIQYDSGSTNFYGHHGQPLGGQHAPDPNLTTKGVSYNDVFDASGNPISQFNPVLNSVIGGISRTTSVLSARSETEKQEVKNIWWGDTPTNGEPSSLMWDNGAGGSGYTDPNGLWRNGTSGTFNKLISELMGEARLYNQQSSDYKWSLVTAVSSINSWFNDGTGARPFYINPVGRIYDQEEEIVYYMLRGTFNMLKDEWDAEWLQISYDNSVSTTTTTIDTGGFEPTQNVISARLAGPSSGEQDEALRLTNLSADVAVGTVTSLSITPLNRVVYNETKLYEQNTIIKTGDKFILEGNGYFHEFTASADVGDTDTTISVESTTTIAPFYTGNQIKVNHRDLYQQYQHKTRGTIGGMTVTSTSIDGAGTVGRETISFRCEGNNISSENYYVSEGEDNTRNGRWSELQPDAPSQIGTQRAMKGARGLIVNTAILEKGRVVISGSGTSTITIELYKVTPVDNASAKLSQTLMATCTITCNGNAKPRLAEFTIESSEEISPGDLIIPTISTAGEEVAFRGVISYTLKYT